MSAFDPEAERSSPAAAVLRALDARRVDYVVIGGLTEPAAARGAEALESADFCDVCAWPARPASARACDDSRVPQRHFVKYTFLKVDPAWGRLPRGEREQHKREFMAACENFGEDHYVRAYSLVGTRGDADLMLQMEAENLERIHEFHVVLAQAGLMKWSSQPYSYLAMTKLSEYSDESRLMLREHDNRYLFIYPFVKTRAWYALPAPERGRIMAEHIRVGKAYPTVDINTSYSFGLDDQEFVIAFNTDNPADFLDLVQRLRGTESSAYTLRDTPTFTCISCSVERALNALDGAPLSVAAG